MRIAAHGRWTDRRGLHRLSVEFSSGRPRVITLRAANDGRTLPYSKSPTGYGVCRNPLSWSLSCAEKSGPASVTAVTRLVGPFDSRTSTPTSMASKPMAFTLFRNLSV